MTSNPLSSDFSYKKYSLEQLDNWVHDALNCEDLTPQDIYNTIVKCVDDSVEYHKKQLNKNIEVLSLLKGHRNIDFIEEYSTTPFSSVSEKDWTDFWEQSEKTQYTEEELDAMCDAASDKEKCREYNLREAEYYNKRSELDGLAEQVKAEGGYEWTPETQKENKNKYYWNRGRNRSYDEMIADGWHMTLDGFWVKDN